MLCVIYFILSLCIKIVLTLFLLFIVVVIGLKLWLEPVKGVCKCRGKLEGKVALVTGGNSGIGLETARALARRGARVIIASRDVARSQRAVEDIKRTTGNERVEYRILDLASFASVRQFAEEFNRTESRLDLLINNSGCGGIRPHLTKDGIDIVTQINYFGAFLLTNLLLDKLIASKPSRIIIVTSLGHRFCTFDPDDIAGLNYKPSVSAWNAWQVYARSKLLQVLWTKALAKRLPLGVTVNAAHPGVVGTDIFHRLPLVYQKILNCLINLLFKTAAEGAQTNIHLCVASELENASGGYYADCKPGTESSLAKDNRLVEKIWNDSLALTVKK